MIQNTHQNQYVLPIARSSVRVVMPKCRRTSSEYSNPFQVRTPSQLMHLVQILGANRLIHLVGWEELVDSGASTLGLMLTAFQRILEDYP